MTAKILNLDEHRDLTLRIEQVARRLMSAREDERGFRMNVPVIYPSGSGCSVEIIPNGELLFVSDIGLGHMEAEYSGASDHYDRQARTAAERFGVGYDGFSMFALRVHLSRLDGAIVAIANASVQAASAAIRRAAEDKERRINDSVFEKLSNIFPASMLSKSADIVGQRDTWNVHNVINFETGEKAIFEFVTAHQNSVSSKFLMFSDLSGAERRLALNAVTKDISALGSRGAMLSDVSNLIELSAANDQFERYARRMLSA